MFSNIKIGQQVKIAWLHAGKGYSKSEQSATVIELLTDGGFKAKTQGSVAVPSTDYSFKQDGTPIPKKFVGLQFSPSAISL